MANIYNFIETLRRLLQNPALATQNTILDASLLTQYIDRVNALTPDVILWRAPADVSSSEGSLSANVLKNAIELDVTGFEYRLSKFRDGLQSTPRKIRRRVPGDTLFATPTDRVRYVLADPTDGVLLLDQNLEIVRTFPGLIPSGTIAGAQYRNAETAVSCTLAATEYMIIACGAPQHVVQVFNYSTGALVATIGVPGTAGLPTDLTPGLTDPVSITVDETNARLFIACRTGNPGADVTNSGFVAEFDISVPATPTFVQYVLQGKGLYRLNNTECRRPSDVFFVPTTGLLGAAPDRLYVSNGLGDTAAFERATLTDPWFPSLVLEAQGQGWVTGPDTITGADFSENALDVLTDSNAATRLYVAASKTAQVEVFRVSVGDSEYPFGAHEATYGQRGIETTMPYNSMLRVYSTPQQPKLTFGVFSSATGVCADEPVLPGETTATPVLLVADADAGRLQRLRLPVYSSANLVTFSGQSSSVPVSVVGWFLPADATFPTGFLTLEVRDPGDATVTPAIPSTPWREVPPAGSPAQGVTLTRYQFRLRARLPTDAPIKAYQANAVGVILRQSW
jgi:hypothetical protein